MANAFRSHLTHGAGKQTRPLSVVWSQFAEWVWNPSLFDIGRQSGTKGICWNRYAQLRWRGRSHVFVDVLESIQNYELRKRLLSTEKHKNQEFAIMYAVRGES